MNTMRAEDPNYGSIPQRPAGPPFAAAYRPTPPGAPQTTTPFLSSGPVVGSEASGFRPTQTLNSNIPSMPPPPSSYGPAVPLQRFPTPQFSSTAQPLPLRPSPPGQPVLTSPFKSPGVHLPSPSVSLHQPHIPSMPMGSPPQSVSHLPSRMSGPQPFQSTFPGYPSKPSAVLTQPPPVQPAPFVTHQGGYGPPPPATSAHLLSHQRGYVHPPLVAQMQHQGSGPPMGPPMGTLQGLTEDFSSLSLASIPGSLDPGLDSKVLPRPLDGDMEPKSLDEMYPMNCHSRYLCLTTSAIPNSSSLVSKWHLPLGAVVCPLAEAPDGEVPILNFSPTGIVRCRRCRTYVNPYVTFTDGGRKWRCNICSLLNDVPGDYFAHLDAGGRRVDLNERPELTKGSVEFIAPAEYMVRAPMPPLYFFLIDVSISAIRSGMLESSLMQPQMMVVSDLDDIFVPLPDDLLVNLSESRSVVDAFVDSLPSMFQDNVNVESAFGPALKAAFMVMHKLGGKLLIFQNTLPSLGVGRLRLRGDDLRAYGTDKEQALRMPEDPFYKQMAADCTKYQIAVNVYAFSDKYTDIASLGVKFTSYHGNFMLRSTDLLALPAVDCDKAYAMQLGLEEALLTAQTVYFQVALLYPLTYISKNFNSPITRACNCGSCLLEKLLIRYTSSSGERRIRVHTAAAPIVTDLGEMYRRADTGAIISLLSRLAIEKTLSYKLEEARNSVQQRIVKALREYRNLYAVQHRLGGRMIYPESLKLLPLYGLALCKSIPLRGGYADAQLDERCAAGYTMMSLPVKNLLKLLYPSLVRVDEYLLKASSQADELDTLRLPVTAQSLDSRGLYIYDDGLHFVIWFGKMLPPDVAMNLLGGDFATDLSKVNLCEHDSELSRKLMKILKKFREIDPSYYQLCHLVRQGEQPREGFFLLQNLVEDQVGGMNGYVDWILQIHRQVQQNA
ncbi:hypothetical protein RHGRI_002916 [Rhododendron griersonianum]|uniref:Protein transport protein Sec24-like At3g07100 n=1 Tax=Rhododendron griersonianum TaxID=479676 RepID=A0AAV6LTI4_9ERIC|nr:hypothetical protein RHGRI_002916 [Rhododendron griersonianum]